jgi:hypothetical protein
MHGEEFKKIEAGEAKLCNNCIKTKLKLLKKNAAIWFNKLCKTKQLTLKCTNITANGNNKQSRTHEQ